MLKSSYIKAEPGSFVAVDDPRIVASPEVSAAPYFLSSTPRELRAQTIQRLQVGIFGLIIILLLVSLADVIIQHVRAVDNASGLIVTGKATSTASGTDPLADIGAAPSPEASAAPHRLTTPRSANH